MVKILKFFDADPGSRIRAGDSSDPGSGMEKSRSRDPGSGINIPDPQHGVSLSLYIFDREDEPGAANLLRSRHMSQASLDLDTLSGHDLGHAEDPEN